jgi:hydrocephalus-inducing protein
LLFFFFLLTPYPQAASGDLSREALRKEAFLFTDSVFALEPLQGEIWPNGEAEFTVTFLPELASEYVTAAFLDVTGREDRIPLQLKGEGLGPKIRFSFERLDIGGVFVNSTQQYEVFLSLSSLFSVFILLSHTHLSLSLSR